MTFEVALRHHLRFNHYPPIVDGEKFAQLAIEAVQEGEPSRLISDGDYVGIADSVVEGWHLDSFIDGREE